VSAVSINSGAQDLQLELNLIHLFLTQVEEDFVSAGLGHPSGIELLLIVGHLKMGCHQALYPNPGRELVEA
jgi:hypothetical protein